ncbi:MAG: DUF2279 domain-containing protein [Phaeodactylibacter sp.]|nr:DUF2279 domain-containing protein [Phaeodactylibacter sp.]
MRFARPVLFLLLLFPLWASAQAPERLRMLEMPDTLHAARFWTCVSGGTLIYSGVSYGLWQAWYKGFDLGPFHFFNDFGEWEHIDKAGHLFTAYHEAQWVFGGARWTGMQRRKALWTGVAVGSGLQLTIEVMDGFSEKWGFSVPDFAANTLGVSLFAVQELLWEEQRAQLKLSPSPNHYPSMPITSLDGMQQTNLSDRVAELYGTGFFESFLKDYNAQTYWLSVNPAAFFTDTPKWLPAWLNVALGYGAGNLFGGYANAWPSEEPAYLLSDAVYPRYRQYYLSLDVDLRRIPVKSRFVKFLFGVVNFIKIPAPALEINSLGTVRFHPLFW